MYLLSNDIVVMIRLDLESAVVGPEIYRGGDAGDASLIDLENYGSADVTLKTWTGFPPTISAASVPATENSRSAYFFQ